MFTKPAILSGILTFLILVVAGKAEDGPYLGLDQLSQDNARSAPPLPSPRAVVRLPSIHDAVERVSLGDTSLVEYPDTGAAERCSLGQKGSEAGSEACRLSTVPLRPGKPSIVNPVPSPGMRRGKKHGLWVDCYPSGKKRAEGQYDHNLPTGKFTWWYENGQKQIEGEFVAGKRQGTWASWHRNGVKASEAEYQDGQVLGERVQWNRAGQSIESPSEGAVRGRMVTAGGSTHSVR